MSQLHSGWRDQEHLLSARFGFTPHLHPMFIMCIRLQCRSLRRVWCVHEDKEHNPSVLLHLALMPPFTWGVRLEGELQSTVVPPYQHSFNLPLFKNILTHQSHRSSYYPLPQKNPLIKIEYENVIVVERQKQIFAYNKNIPSRLK